MQCSETLVSCKPIHTILKTEEAEASETSAPDTNLHVLRSQSYPVRRESSRLEVRHALKYYNNVATADGRSCKKGLGLERNFSKDRPGLQRPVPYSEPPKPASNSEVRQSMTGQGLNILDTLASSHLSALTEMPPRFAVATSCQDWTRIQSPALTVGSTCGTTAMRWQRDDDTTDSQTSHVQVFR